MTSISRMSAALAVITLTAAMAACSNTARGVKEDTANLGDKIAAGAETVDVKTALISDATLDADAIDVDTDAKTKTVTLRGSVPTDEQKAEAERIARNEAPGYRIVNRLAVVPK